MKRLALGKKKGNRKLFTFSVVLWKKKIKLKKIKKNPIFFSCLPVHWELNTTQYGNTHNLPYISLYLWFMAVLQAIALADGQLIPTKVSDMKAGAGELLLIVTFSL